MSWRSRCKTGAVVLGALVAISAIGAAAAVTGVAVIGGAVIGVAVIGGAQAGRAGQLTVAGVADASVTGDFTAAVTDQVSGSAQRVALNHWTAGRMRSATALSPVLGRPVTTRGPIEPIESQAAPDVTAPKGIPRAASFTGSPTTGALFYTTGGKNHFCTASVVGSPAGDMVLTAAHCVYWKGFAANIEYVPGYYNGKQPYGAWPVATITVASGWESSHNPELDFAFLTLAKVDGEQVQTRTGALTIGFTRWYSEKIEVIGHNDTASEPVRCATKSFRFRTGTMEFYCHGFWTGTSGGPWIIDYNAKKGTGTVFGVIGGYELGGDYEWASYSAYFGSATRALYTEVERASAPGTKPTASPSPTTSPTASPTKSATATATASATASASATATASATPAVTVTPAVTRAPTPSATGSISTSYHLAADERRAGRPGGAVIGARRVFTPLFR